jgi:hypothetical protein
MACGSLECGARRVRSRLGIATIVVGLLIIAPFLITSGVAADDLDTEKLDPLARQVLKGVRGPARVALRLLSDGRSGLPAEIADRLDAEMLAAIRRRAPSGVTLVARADLAAAWREAIEFSDRSVQDLLREARADVLVTGEARALQSGLEVSYRAISLKDGSVGRLLAAPRPILLQVPGLNLDDLIFRQTLWRVADELVLAAASKEDANGAAQAVDVVASGAGGAFAQHVRKLALARIQDRLGRRAATAEVPVNAAPSRRTALHLSLEIWDQGDVVSVTLKLNGAGISESRVARLAMGLIPTHFLPLTRAGGKVGSGMYQARGGAWSTEIRSDRQARAAARALARARVVASALGLPMPLSDAVETPNEMVALRRLLERGITHDEVWVSRMAGADGDVAVNLRALVQSVGGPAAPSVGIAFNGANMVAGETLKLMISAKRRAAHVAVYSWDAVDGVHLLYPSGAMQAMRIDRGGTLVLPPVQGPEYGVAPLRGQKVSAESLIVLASAVPFEAAGLATIPSDGRRGTALLSQPVSRFFDAVAKLDLEVMSLRILDYSVRKIE